MFRLNARYPKAVSCGMNRFFRYHIDHVLFWALTLGFHAYTRMYLIDKASTVQFALEIIVRNVLLAGVIYFNLLVVIPRINQGKAFAWTIASLGSLALYVFGKNLHDVYLYGYVIGDPDKIDFFHSSFYNFSIVLFYLAFAGALYLSKQWYVQRELLQKIKLEKLNTELDYLKAQMNPHFLFNSINTIFFQINKENTEARETLGKFSEMLRYQLYECNGTEIAIEKELAYLKNYVELQKLRRSQHDVIEFTVSETLRNFSLPPLLLIPFIENAFKHISNHTDKPNRIEIVLRKQGEALELQVINTTDGGESREPGGIGLKNVQRRLELLYPGKHSLTFEKTDESFSVTLNFSIA